MNRLFPIASLLLALVAAACGRPASDAGGAVPPPAAPEAIRLSAAQRRDAGVATAAAGPQRIAETLSVYGELQPLPEQLRRVSARYPGVARRVAKRIGDRVAAGETLLVAESNDSLEPYRIAAPIAGRVIERGVNEGEALDGQVLFTIVELSRLRAELAVFPRDAAQIAVGQSVAIRAEREAAPALATIDGIAPRAGERDRGLRLYATLDNADGRWRLGQFVSAEIVVAARNVALAVPQSALQDLDGGPGVFVETAAGFVPRTLRLGAQDRQYAEVLDGLAAGEQVVVANSFLLKSAWLAQSEE